MEHVSTTGTLYVYGCWALAVALLLLTVRSAARRARTSVPRAIGWTVCILAVWTFAALAIGKLGWMRTLEMPPGAAKVAVTAALLTIVMATLRPGRWLGDNAALAWLLGAQAFRIPVEIMLHRWYLEGAIPERMTFLGWNYDILSGALGLVLGIGVARNWFKRPKTIARLYNILGILLLATIVVTAALSIPGPLNNFPQEPLNRIVRNAPYSLLPLCLVMTALFLHIVTFRALRRDDL